MQLSAITPVILTYNEAANIERSLAAVGWADRIVVVDSGSTDGTAEIVKRFGKASLYVRPFDRHAEQWTYALTGTGIDTEWVLVLDADHVMTPALIREIAALDPPDRVAGYRTGFIYCIDGHALRGSLYPATVTLARRHRVRFVQDGHTQRLVCEGAVGELQEKLLHDDRKSAERWRQSQRRYMALEAAKLRAAKWRDLDWADRLRLLRVVAPPLVFFYCLFGKGLLFEGRPGLRYALQRAGAEATLSMILLRGAGKADRP